MAADLRQGLNRAFHGPICACRYVLCQEQLPWWQDLVSQHVHTELFDCRVSLMESAFYKATEA